MIVQVDIASAQEVSSPKYLNCAHRTKARTNVPNEDKNNVTSDNLGLLKNYVDGQRYPRDSLIINYGESDYIERYTLYNYFLKNRSENQY